MGGGGVMRAAAKVAGFGIVNAGLRSPMPAPPAEHSLRKASIPVSAMVSSSSAAAATAGEAATSGVQTSSWRLDDWELAGDEHDMVLDAGEPLARVVFGGAPTFQEAKEATDELKDALEKVYLSPPSSQHPEDSPAVDHRPHGLGLASLSENEHLETKSSVSVDSAVSPSVPKHALQAFRFLNESPRVQTVVASIASDPNVWNAVLANDALTEFIQSHKNSPGLLDADVSSNESVTGFYLGDEKTFEEQADSKDSGRLLKSVTDVLEKLRLSILGLVNDALVLFKNMFGTSVVDTDADENGQKNFFSEKILRQSVFGLAVMVIFVVVLKRG